MDGRFLEVCAIGWHPEKEHCGAKSVFNFHVFPNAFRVGVDYLGIFPSSSHSAATHILFATLYIRLCSEGSHVCVHVCVCAASTMMLLHEKEALLQWLAGEETSVKILHYSKANDWKEFSANCYNVKLQLICIALLLRSFGTI